MNFMQVNILFLLKGMYPWCFRTITIVSGIALVHLFSGSENVVWHKVRVAVDKMASSVVLI